MFFLTETPNKTSRKKGEHFETVMLVLIDFEVGYVLECKSVICVYCSNQIENDKYQNTLR